MTLEEYQLLAPLLGVDRGAFKPDGMFPDSSPNTINKPINKTRRREDEPRPKHKATVHRPTGWEARRT